MTNFKNIIFLGVITFWFSVAISCNDVPTEPIQENILVPKDTNTNLSIKENIDTSQMIDSTTIPQKIAKPTRKPAQMKFETTIFNYDTISQGKVVEYEFKFKNIGELPLSIKDVKGSCGCTIGSYPFLDIAPNEENSIKARFDSKGKKGQQSTTITVYSNGEPKEVVLSLKGFVKE